MKILPDSLATTIGEALKRARTQRSWSQAETAERAGIAVEVYGRLERGRIVPMATTLVRLAVALGASTDSLVGLGMPNHEPLVLEADAPEGKGSLLKRREARRLLRRLDAASPRTLQLLDLLLSAIAKDAARARPKTPKRKRDARRL
jgi:transcriptional regulator with XRE-family HTH domain